MASYHMWIITEFVFTYGELNRVRPPRRLDPPRGSLGPSETSGYSSDYGTWERNTPLVAAASEAESLCSTDRMGGYSDTSGRRCMAEYAISIASIVPICGKQTGRNGPSALG